MSKPSFINVEQLQTQLAQVKMPASKFFELFDDEPLKSAIVDEQVATTAIWFINNNFNVEFLGNLLNLHPTLKNFSLTQKTTLILSWLEKNHLTDVDAFANMLNKVYAPNEAVLPQETQRNVVTVLKKWAAKNKVRHTEMNSLLSQDLFSQFVRREKPASPAKEDMPKSPYLLILERLSQPQKAKPSKETILAFLNIFKIENNLFGADLPETSFDREIVKGRKERAVILWLEKHHPNLWHEKHNTDFNFKALTDFFNAEDGLKDLSANAKCRITAAWLRVPGNVMAGRNLMQLINPTGIFADADSTNKVYLLCEWIRRNKEHLTPGTIDQILATNIKFETSALEKDHIRAAYSGQMPASPVISAPPSTFPSTPSSPTRQSQSSSPTRQSQSSSPTKTSPSPTKIDNILLPDNLSFSQLARFLATNRIAVQLPLESKVAMISEWIMHPKNKNEVSEAGFFDRLLTLFKPDEALGYYVIDDKKTLSIEQKIATIFNFIGKIGDTKISTMQMLNLCKIQNILWEATAKERMELFFRCQDDFGDNLKLGDLFLLFTNHGQLSDCDSMIKSHIILKWLDRDPGNKFNKSELETLFSACPEFMVEQKKAIVKKCQEKEIDDKIIQELSSLLISEPEIVGPTLEDVAGLFAHAHPPLNQGEKIFETLEAAKMQTDFEQRLRIYSLFHSDPDLKTIRPMAVHNAVTRYLALEGRDQIDLGRKTIAICDEIEQAIKLPAKQTNPTAAGKLYKDNGKDKGAKSEK